VAWCNCKPVHSKTAKRNLDEFGEQRIVDPFAAIGHAVHNVIIVMEGTNSEKLQQMLRSIDQIWNTAISQSKASHIYL
jgi:nitrate reductase NapAB chaperone NapD